MSSSTIGIKSNSITISSLKRSAKKVSRDTGVTHSEALDSIAQAHGYRNWSLLSKHGAFGVDHSASSNPLGITSRLDASDRIDVLFVDAGKSLGLLNHLLNGDDYEYEEDYEEARLEDLALSRKIGLSERTYLLILGAYFNDLFDSEYGSPFWVQTQNLSSIREIRENLAPSISEIAEAIRRHDGGNSQQADFVGAINSIFDWIVKSKSKEKLAEPNEVTRAMGISDKDGASYALDELFAYAGESLGLFDYVDDKHDGTAILEDMALAERLGISNRAYIAMAGARHNDLIDCGLWVHTSSNSEIKKIRKEFKPVVAEITAALKKLADGDDEARSFQSSFDGIFDWLLKCKS